MLLKRMIKKHTIDDYILAIYKTRTGRNIVSLLVVNDSRLYDIVNKIDISSCKVQCTKPLLEYIKDEFDVNTEISHKTAQKLALPHYQKFKEQYLNGKQVLEDNEYSFYHML